MKTIEYDPNRTANIALLLYADGERNYIIAPEGLKVGDKYQSGPDSPIKSGNALSLKLMPLEQWFIVWNFFLARAAQMIRSAGSSAQILG